MSIDVPIFWMGRAEKYAPIVARVASRAVAGDATQSPLLLEAPCFL